MVNSDQYKRILSGAYVPTQPTVPLNPSAGLKDNQRMQVEPPPLPIQIFIHRDNKRFGPYDLQQVQAWLGTGHLNIGDMAWYEGAQGWVALSQVPGIEMPCTPRK
jgi:hypothetical protein